MNKINQGQKYKGQRNVEKRGGYTKGPKGGGNSGFISTAESWALPVLAAVAVVAIVVIVVLTSPIDAIVVGAAALATAIGGALSLAFSW